MRNSRGAQPVAVIDTTSDPERTATTLTTSDRALRESHGHPGDLLTRRQRLVYVLILGALTALGPFTIDLYLPAFPRVVEELRTTDGMVQLTLTATAIGFGLGQLLIGPLSDKIGRRGPLVLATGVHILASVAIVFAPTIELVAVLRVGQGLGAAAGGVVAMAMVRDLFGGKPLVRMLARLALVNGLAPVLAPVIGSQLLRVMDWRGVFVFLAAYGALVLIAVAVFIVETLPPERRHAAGHSTARERFGALFHDRVFIGVSIVGGMVFASILTYVSSSPFLLQDVYGVDAQQFGLLFGLNSIGLVIASQLASRLMRRIGPQWILAVGLVFVAAAAIALIVLADSEAGVFSVIVPFFVLVSACGLCFPCAQVLALANHGEEAGTAAAVTGSANATIAGLVSPIPGIIGLTSGAPVGLVVGIAVAIALIALWAIVRPWSVPALAD